MSKNRLEEIEEELRKKREVIKKFPEWKFIYEFTVKAYALCDDLPNGAELFQFDKYECVPWEIVDHDSEDEAADLVYESEREPMREYCNVENSDAILICYELYDLLFNYEAFGETSFLGKELTKKLYCLLFETAEKYGLLNEWDHDGVIVFRRIDNLK